jgi:hypothetical protein
MNYNAAQDYGIPVAPPHNRGDIEMTDSNPVIPEPAPAPAPAPAQEQYTTARSNELNKSRSPVGKRVVYYRSMEPEPVWSATQQPKKEEQRIGKSIFFAPIKISENNQFFRFYTEITSRIMLLHCILVRF